MLKHCSYKGLPRILTKAETSFYISPFADIFVWAISNGFRTLILILRKGQDKKKKRQYTSFIWIFFFFNLSKCWSTWYTAFSLFWEKEIKKTEGFLPQEEHVLSKEKKKNRSYELYNVYFYKSKIMRFWKAEKN